MNSLSRRSLLDNADKYFQRWTPHTFICIEVDTIPSVDGEVNEIEDDRRTRHLLPDEETRRKLWMAQDCIFPSSTWQKVKKVSLGSPVPV
eukprot:scaffold10365_cov102-Skeletonema_dohrnii-CCMP3373.AAC.2